MAKKPPPRRTAAPLTTYNAAQHLAQLGYHVVALYPNTKVPVSPKDDGKAWLRYRHTVDDIPDHFTATSNLGLLTGTEVAPGIFLVAVDIDVNDPVLIERIRL